MKRSPLSEKIIPRARNLAQHCRPSRLAAFGRHAADVRGAGQEAACGCAATCLLKSLGTLGVVQVATLAGPRGSFDCRAATIIGLRLHLLSDSRHPA